MRYDPNALFHLSAPARTQAREVLPFVTSDALQRLQTAIMEGKVEGRVSSTCFFGVLSGSHSDMNYRLLKDNLRRRGVLVSIDHEQNPIEVFSQDIHLGDTPKISFQSQMLLHWVREEFLRRRISEDTRSDMVPGMAQDLHEKALALV